MKGEKRRWRGKQEKCEIIKGERQRREDRGDSPMQKAQ